MNFVWTTIHVKDMEKSLEFYQKVIRLPLKRRFSIDGGMEIAFLGNEGESELELIFESNSQEIDTQGISIGFSCSSPINETLDFVKGNGYEPLTAVISPNPNINFFYIDDPNGYRVQLIEVVG